ncbi:MAG: hypothetical protein HWE10_15725 [Gammaproteobacteria bacterium]|nr:hypothetical protein [Gammaproteobacteria bacterium]
MAKPRKKLPERSVDIYCSKCKTQLLKYKKGGNGALVKCFIERITKDFTQRVGECPKCRSGFARETMIRGTPALKIITAKVQVK